MGATRAAPKRTRAPTHAGALVTRAATRVSVPFGAPAKAATAAAHKTIATRAAPKRTRAPTHAGALVTRAATRVSAPFGAPAKAATPAAHKTIATRPAQGPLAVALV